MGVFSLQLFKKKKRLRCFSPEGKKKLGLGAVFSPIRKKKLGLGAVFPPIRKKNSALTVFNLF